MSEISYFCIYETLKTLADNVIDMWKSPTIKKYQIDSWLSLTDNVITDFVYIENTMEHSQVYANIFIFFLWLVVLQWI